MSSLITKASAVDALTLAFDPLFVDSHRLAGLDNAGIARMASVVALTVETRQRGGANRAPVPEVVWDDCVEIMADMVLRTAFEF